MRVAIVGGGIGGLTAARTLVAAGIDAHVLEAAPRPGGVIGTSRVDGFLREHAASSFLGGPSRGALALCHELGVEVEHASPRAKRRWIFIDGKLRAVPASPVDLVRSDLLTWRGKLDLLREPLRPPTQSEEDESIHAFAARRLGAEAARALVAPFVTGIYAADAHDISVQAGFPKLAELERHGGLVRGMLRQAGRGMLGRVLGRRTQKTPRGMWAPRGGLAKLIDALATSLGPRVQLGRTVEQIAPSRGGVSIDGELWDGVVLALPAQQARTLVTLPELATRLDAFYRAPTALAYLGYAEGDVEGGRDGFGALVALGEDVRLLGVVFESVVWEDRAPAGQVLLRCIFGGGRDPEAASLTDAQLIDQARRDLGVVLGISAKPTHASVVRWERGIAQYPVGHRDHVRAAVTAARTHKIALAGADYCGPGVNDLCADSARILDEVRAWG
ncbi:MAG TPA: protoporphyrinogen oxidase [Kofleriaceae bacterium]|nr:protoporphyrinogen oxidase [Kofleriaceae bacterium]